MPELSTIIQRRHDVDVLADSPQPIIDGTQNHYMTMCLLKGSKIAGPQVLIISYDVTGTMCMQISLHKFLMGADKLVELAKNEWDWKSPNTYHHLMRTEQNPRTARRMALETIKAELEKLEAEEEANE